MSGRWILTLMVATAVLMAGSFYFVLKRAPAYKGLVTSELLSEFHDYSKTIRKMDRLLVAEFDNQKFFVPLQAGWKMEIRDKVLLVSSPIPVNESGTRPLPVSQVSQARKAVEDFIWVWLEDKYHSRKDIQLEVRFEGPAPVPLPN